VYCQDCGSFGSCICGNEPDIVSLAQVEALIREYNDDKSEEVYATAEPWDVDLSKLRRRVEDALRKTGDLSTLLAFASRLGVKF
jgi:hypothetical protein